MQQYRKHPWITIHTVTEQNRKQHEIPFILPWKSTENIHGLPFILSQNRLKNTAWITIHTTVEQYRKHPWITIHTVTEQTKKKYKKNGLPFTWPWNTTGNMHGLPFSQIERTENTACVHILETPETPCANTMYCTIYTVTYVWRCFCIMNKRVHLNAAKNDEVQFHLNCQNATDWLVIIAQNNNKWTLKPNLFTTGSKHIKDPN